MPRISASLDSLYWDTKEREENEQFPAASGYAAARFDDELRRLHDDLVNAETAQRAQPELVPDERGLIRKTADAYTKAKQRTLERTPYPARGVMGALWNAAEFPVRPKTGAWDRFIDLLRTSDYAIGETTAPLIDKFYYGKEDAGWDDIGKGLLHGLKGGVSASGGKRGLIELFESPRYGEPLTALQRMVETAGTGRDFVGPAVDRIEQGPQISGDEVAHPEQMTPLRAFALTQSSHLTPEGYARSKTQVPPFVAGLLGEVLLNPATWLRGPGMTRSGQAAWRFGNASDEIADVIKTGEGFADLSPKLQAQVGGIVDAAAEYGTKTGKPLPAGLPAKVADQADEGLYALMRTFEGEPVIKGGGVYRIGEHLRKALSRHGGLTRTLNSLGELASVNYRKMPTGPRQLIAEGAEGAAPAASTLDDVGKGAKAADAIPEATRVADELPFETYADYRTRLKSAVDQAEVAGFHEREQFAKALGGIPKQPRDVLNRASHPWELGREVPDVLKPSLEASEPFRAKWPGQQLKRGGKLVEGVYSPHGLGPGKTGSPSFGYHRKNPNLTFYEATQQLPGYKRAHLYTMWLDRAEAGAASDVLIDSLDDLTAKFATAVGPDELMDALKTIPDGHVPVVVNPEAGAGGAGAYITLNNAAEAAEHAGMGRTVFLIPDELADFGNKYATLTATNDWPAWLSGWRGYLGHWKVSKLGTRLPYWIRNYATEEFWNYLRNPEIFNPELRKVTRAIARGEGDGIVEGLAGRMTYNEVRENVLPRLRHMGQMGAEEHDITTAVVGRTPMQKVNAPAIWAMNKMSPYIEDEPRLAQWLWEFTRNGASADEGIELTHAFHINYHKIPKAQNKVVKSVFPFSTFPIGASKILAREGMRQPHKLLNVGRLQRGMEHMTQKWWDEEAPPPEFVPDFVARRDPIYLGSSPERGHYRMGVQEGWNPGSTMSEVGGLLSGPDAWLAETGPIGNAIVGWRNVTAHSQRELDAAPGVKTTVAGVPLSRRLWAVIEGLTPAPYPMMVSDLDRLNPGGIFGTEDERGMSTGRLAKALMQTAAHPAGAVTADWNVWDTGRKKTYPETPEGLRWLRAGTGLTVYDIDRKKSADSYLMDQLMWGSDYATYKWQAQQATAVGNKEDAARYRALAEAERERLRALSRER